jgi:valyl-tRNA synthetase
VREAFVRLYEKGLIYRGPRMINWSPGLKTAVSDLEVEYSKSRASCTSSNTCWRMAPRVYPGGHHPPETILGDTAVAVHPEDERYQKFVGPQGGRAGAGARDPGHRR